MLRTTSRLLQRLAGRRAKVVVLVAGLLLAAAILAFSGTGPTSDDPSADLPAGAESRAVAERSTRFADAGLLPAIVVLSRAGDAPLRAEDRAAARDLRRRIADAQAVSRADGAPVALQVLPRAAVLVVPLRAAAAANADDERLTAAVERIRLLAGRDLPAGLDVATTGPAAFQVDLSAVFDGADVTLLATTAAVVALLLLLTYRSPWLWLVPLTVIGLADRVVVGLLAIVGRATGFVADDGTAGITSVLVFGAGTNYALLLIARYREELRRHPDTHDAMRAALGGAVPAILASSGTVILSLVVIAFARLPFDRSVGIAGALGIAGAVVFVLALLPPALLLFGRRLFWPFVPRDGDADPSRSGGWARLGGAVTRRPALVAAGASIALLALASGVLGERVGLSQTEQFRETPESVTGQETLARIVGPGASESTTVVARREAEGEALRVLGATPGVQDARVGGRAGDLVQLQARLRDGPGSDAALRTVERLRDRLDAVPGSPQVGGADAEQLDREDAAARDRLVVAPLVLLVVGLVLIAVLRSLVGAAVLLATVVLSYGAAMGAASLLFRTVLDFPALDLGVPLLAFLFLVALGVDYNIFLTTRAREEARTRPTREAIVRALAVTGGVITSAGVLLAAVFTVLGVLPLILLTQLGVIVGLGVLLDTLLVRTVLVPALVALLGDRFWWPGDPRRAPAAPDAAPTVRG